MSLINQKKGFHNYDKYPEIKVEGFENCVWEGYQDILAEIKRTVQKRRKTVLVLDFYPGVNTEELLSAFSKLEPAMVFCSEECLLDCFSFEEKIQENLTEDRVFGVLTTKMLEDYFIQEKIKQTQQKIQEGEEGLFLVYGVGASILTKGDILVYCDLARWEIQLRYRQGMPNFHADNKEDAQLAKYKRGFFVDWRLADRHKKKLFEEIDYVLDTNQADMPKMVSGLAFIGALRQAARRPFRTVPYFDAGVWGGQWMKEVCGLDEKQQNYAWCFDGVPEENSLFFRFGKIRIEVPAIDLVFYQPHELLGERVHGRFGDEFPIRFDLLDTIEGGNLSLQVHPLTEYIQQTFGMHYTQDESYYILDCEKEKEPFVYLGLKENINPEQMLSDLERAEKGESIFDTEKYINCFPAKKHDHFLIPAGTIHCSGAGCMVLEISATPYIFTFKLWDWERTGLDGLPRPIHLKHGKQVIQWDRTTKWVEENLVNAVELVKEDVNMKEEKTGLHEREFVETRRHIFTSSVLHKTNGSVNVLNLVGGEEAEVFSSTGIFEPFVIHYAETFIIPACVDEYGIRPTKGSEGQQLITIKAYVR